MSALLGRVLNVALGAGHVQVDVLSNAWTNRPIERAILHSPSPAGSVAAWTTGLEVFSRWLDQRSFQGASLHLIVDDIFVRYAVVPWRADLQRTPERKSLALACFEVAYGGSMDGWDIRIDAAVRRRPAIACAIELGFISSVRHVCRARGLTLKLCRPSFIHKLSAEWQEMPSVEHLVVSVGERAVVGGTRSAEGWSSVWLRHLPSSPDCGAMSSCWQDILRQEYLLRGYVDGMPILLLEKKSVFTLPSARAVAQSGLVENAH
ncbi:MAG TPA: hypothetical protein VGE57_09080 [Solimonas sp.]